MAQTPVTPITQNLAGNKSFFRISYVRSYSAEQYHKKGSTPEPFCELRAFIFLPRKPTIIELKQINNGLEQVINYTETLFQSIYDAKEADSLEQDDKLVEYEVRTRFSTTPKVVMRIDGFECEKLNVDEVAKHFREDVDKIRTFEIYRYIAFANPDGTISYEYDENAVKSMENIRSQRQQQIP
jgi:hypothetical protein